MTKYSLGFMFSENKEDVLLIKKAHPENQAGRWNGLGGRLEQGESYFDSMVREFQEEAHIETHREDWTTLGLMQGANFSVRIFYTFSNDLYRARSTTVEAVKITPVSDLHKMPLVKGVAWMVPLALEGDYVINGIYMPDLPSVMEMYEDV